MTERIGIAPEGNLLPPPVPAAEVVELAEPTPIKPERTGFLKWLLG